MSGLAKYTCEACGQEHEDWPALTWDSPLQYNILPDEVKKARADLDSDFCVIRHDAQVDRFIRVSLVQPVHGRCDGLHYGLWVSLSEEKFLAYADKYGNREADAARYFGWLCNEIPGYDSTLSIPMNVTTRIGNLRPVVEPHQDFDHPFVRDYYRGISLAEAERRVQELLDVVSKRESGYGQ
ncbi:MAG: DUF2199 domain-containing protein [Flavobacteriales bacterium]|nr:DUF2199 domain-containing protein [Flavobacteriales bacterium]